MKAKFKRKAQAGVNIFEDNQPQLQPNSGVDYTWMNSALPGEVPVNPDAPDAGPMIQEEGDKVEQGKIIPLGTKTMVGTGRYKDNPYVTAFNAAATGVTSIANIIQNNKLKNRERQQLLHSLEPAYFENMEGQGLNNLPMYTQYGGFAHEAFYGDDAISAGPWRMDGAFFKAGGNVYKRKYAAGGDLSPDKAKKMLKEGKANGKPLTEQQRKYFGWVAGGRKQTGGSTPQNIRNITPAEMGQWNQFLDFVKEKGYEGSPDLNAKNKNLGSTLFADFKKANPNISINYDIVPSVQSAMQNLRTESQGFLKRRNDPRAETVMQGISPVDGWFGSKTSQFRFPSMAKEEYTNGVLTKQENLGLVDQNFNPTGNTTGSVDLTTGQRVIPGQQQSQPAAQKILPNSQYVNATNGRPIPKDVKIEQLQDGLYYEDPHEGMLVKVKQMKAGGKNKNHMYCQTGGMMEVNGLPDELAHLADVEAEAGEVFETTNGRIGKVSDTGNTHEQGGEMIPNVSRVLEDTSDKRKDKASKALKIQPADVKEIFGFKPKSAASHAKTYEVVKKELDKTNKQYTGANKNANELDRLTPVTINSLKMNDKFQSELPSEEEIFDVLFNHQEGVKMQQGINDDGSMKKFGGKAQTGKGVRRLSRTATKEQRANYVYNEGDGLFYTKEDYAKLPQEAKVAQPESDLGLYQGPKNKSGRNLYSPTGETTEAKMSDKDIVAAYKAAGIDLGNVKGKDLQQKVYDYIIENQPEVLQGILKKYGPNIQSENMGLAKNKAFTDPMNASKEDLRAILPGLLDAMPGARLPIPSVSDKTSVEEGVPEEQPKGRTILDASVNVNPRFVRQPSNNFNEPTYWSDVAGPLAGLVDSFRRNPELYNPKEFHQLRYKLLDPTAALNANQADFNAALDATNEIGGGLGNANVANMLGQKYRANNQISAQYEGQNAAIKNQEIAYNTAVRDKQSIADAESRGEFYRNVQLGREAQRQQQLTSLSQLARVDQLKRRQNRSGNLVMKLSPAFDQFGEYNGYQYQPYLNPAMVNYNPDIQPTKTTKKSKTQKVTRWTDPSGTTYKTTTTD